VFAAPDIEFSNHDCRWGRILLSCSDQRWESSEKDGG
jgi:hypothetical protein